MPDAARIWPVSAISPTNAAPAGGATPVAAETSAAATARSLAGSSTRMPPATAPNSSARPSGTPALRSTHRRDLLESPEVEAGDLPAGGAVAAPHQGLDLDRERPAARQREGDRRPRDGVRPEQQQFGGIDRRESGGPHLEPGGLSLGAEPVLAPRDHPEPRARIALERQDDVDRVLERSRAREIAVLRDVPGQHDGDALLLRKLDQGVGAGPDLGDPAGLRRRLDVAERLDGIDREHVGAGRPRRGEDRVEISPGRERDRRPPARRAAGRAPRPGHGTPRRRRAGPRSPRAAIDESHWSSSVDLPMPGGPASSTTDPGDEPAAQDPIEVGKPGRAPGRARRTPAASSGDDRAGRPPSPGPIGGPAPPWSSPQAPQPEHRPAHCAEPLTAGRAHEPDRSSCATESTLAGAL